MAITEVGYSVIEGIHPSIGERSGVATIVPRPPLSKPLYIDWSQTKLLAVWDGLNLEELELQQLCPNHPPPATLYIDGCPPYQRDELCSQGYTVYHIKSTIIQALRRALKLKKSDAVDAQLLEKVPKHDWYRHLPMEPHVIEVIKMLKNREFVLKQLKISKQYLKQKGYIDNEFLSEKKEEIDAQLKAIEKTMHSQCKALGLHTLHDNLYGISCLTMLTAFSKRPWTFQHGIGGWLHYNGLTKKSRRETAGRSIGCDCSLKSLIFGAKVGIISKKKKSPWRAEYERLKAELPTYEKPAAAGRGSWKVTSDARAFNRITTQIVVKLYEILVNWHKASGLAANASPP